MPVPVNRFPLLVGEGLIADVLETIRDVVNIASSRIQVEKRGAGRPPVPTSDIVKVLLMQTVRRRR